MDRSLAAAALAGAALASIAVRLVQTRLGASAPAPSLGVEGGEKQWLILVRHGDRFDYANPTWKDRVKGLGGRPRDPPLSALGHRQAERFGRAAAATLGRRGGSVRVRSSPYLRCLQTSMPLCDALDVPLELEPGVAEVQHKVSNVAAFAERLAYFPRLVDAASPDATVDEEAWPLGYMERIARFGAALTAELDEALASGDGASTLVLTSHAASVGLVAWLLGTELASDLRMAPVGCYVLARDSAAEPWRLLRAGDTNAPYNAENSATTFPWGYKPDYLDAWAAAHGGARFPRPTRGGAS